MPTSQTFPPRKPCDGDEEGGGAGACCGAFVNEETYLVERCDTCQRFADDDEATEYVWTAMSRIKWPAPIEFGHASDFADRVNRQLARLKL